MRPAPGIITGARRHLAAGLALLALAGCAAAPRRTEAPPPTPREFRGVWVATVNNIDWPSRRGLPAAEQRAEAKAILDKARALNLNAVIFQIRPAADALYASPLEPWSEYLTGKQGADPGYDPLAFWVEEAHRRGLELHAWFNPYRARHHEAESEFAATHIARTHPTSVKQYGNLWWMDPGDEFASRRTLEVIADVVRRYDVDGIHIDDYFYPYPVAAPRPPGAAPLKPGEPAPTVDFPDEPSWRKYLDAGGKLGRAGWRRQNVDRLVEQIHRKVREIKPRVRFGISPFGLGRPDRRPPGIAGFSQYDQLYADVELWVEKGWLDYLVPQLYWPRAQKAQAFDVLLDYWLAQNGAKRHVWPGLFASAINDTPRSWESDEIVAQVGVARSRPASTGHVQYSMIALMQDRKSVATKLGAGPYAQPAVVPATPWLDAAAPPAPGLRRERDGRVTIIPGAGEPPARYAVWRRAEGGWRFSVQPAAEKSVDPAGADAVVVTALDQVGNESSRASLAWRAPRKD